MKDNHYGPMFEELQRAYPEGTRFHWSEQLFGPSFWLVGVPVMCGGGSGVAWVGVDLQALSARAAA